ncbi:hydroxyacylglutathione hydrolase [Thiobacter aerophilum]|uniref:Hydroxyacylglutathione hydrolase n=1 Tax=Thiobacter aerophilum TaxID=3121275 RepID=A0ABV0EBQ0_9BURK
MLHVIPLPAFQDNYIWLLHDGRSAAVVDPGDATPVMDFLGAHDLALTAILVTHHHHDHVGGVALLARRFSVPVYGPGGEPIPGRTDVADPRQPVDLPHLGIAFQVLAVPGHTRGHVAYYRPKLLFCGDTLFGCGCGRLFEGSAEQMHASLARLAALPDDTGVYCAHEYTLANIRFALQVEADNAALHAREQEARARRAQGSPTVPSTLALERRTNPFLRVTEPAVRAAAEAHAGHPLADAVAVFAALRAWKDRFRA